MVSVGVITIPFKMHNIGMRFLYIVPNTGSSVGSEAGCQSRGFELESQLDQHSFRQ